VPRFSLFACLWCTAILCHQLYQGRLLVLDPTCLLSFAAFWSLLRPACLGRFALVLALHVTTVLFELPRVSNHWLLSGITSSGLLLALGPAFLRRREPSPERLAGALCSVGAQIVLLYAMVTLAKLNAGFFEPEHSCGAEHYRRLAAQLPLLPTAAWAIWAAIVGTLAIEGALPVLLLLRRTRTLACAGGWVFHGMLGFNGYWDFSMMAAAYYVPFLPAGLLRGVRAAAAGSPHIAALRQAASPLADNRRALPLAAALVLVPPGLAALSGASDRELVLAANRAGLWIWFVAWLALGAAAALAYRADKAQAASGADDPHAASLGRGWWRSPVLLLAPLLAFANGLSPYLGLKTENSYTMFSNLRTEGGEWNHYLVPQQLQVFGLQDELVRVLSSQDPYLRRLAAGGYRIVPLELRRYSAEHPDTALSYETRDGRFSARRAAEDPRLRPPPAVLAKLLLFRPVPPAERNECLH